MFGKKGVGCRRLLEQTQDLPIKISDSPKMGVDIAVTNFAFHPLEVKLIIWKLLKVPGVPELWRKLCQGAHGVFYVFNVKDQSSFESITKWMLEVQKVQGILPAVLIGTHADSSQDRVVSFFQAATFAQTNGMMYFDTSIHGGPTLINPIRTLTFEMAKKILK